MSESESDNESAQSEIDPENEAAAHSAAIKRLKTKDPDFYEFLKENEKELLEFEVSEDEKEDEEDEEEVEKKKKSLSAPKLQYLKTQIQQSPSLKLCKQLISAFRNVVQQADGFSDKNDMSSSELNNDIMKLCLIELVPALFRVLKIAPGGKKTKTDLSNSRLWDKTKTVVKPYLIDLLKLYSIIKDSSVLIPLLKHTVHLIPFYTNFVKLSKSLLKRIISFWCSNEETVRVLSLIIIVRTTKSLPKDQLGPVLKSMYFSYVKNTKFTSPTSWPMINFMKRSLTEVYALNPKIAYEHAFIYIRQLAIHLRNALTTKKKESFQTVYNWQYIHCILFWAHLLCHLHQHDAIKTLVYPLVQTAIGTITLIPTSRYVPLRFHLIRCLMQISTETKNFIPTLPFILDVLTMIDYNKKSTFSVKVVNFDCALKVTKSELHGAGLKEKCISEVCSHLMDYFKMYSHTIGFPELALPAILQIKSFIKQCKVSKYNQQLKALLAKVDENVSFITEKRSVSFEITNTEEIQKWEQNVFELKTPLMKYKKIVHEENAQVESKKKKPKIA